MFRPSTLKMLEPNVRLTNRFHWICWCLISLQTTKENQDLKAVRQVNFTDWRAMLGIWESLKRHMEPSRENQSNPFPVQDSEILSMGQNICIGFGLDLAQFVTSPTCPMLNYIWRLDVTLWLQRLHLQSSEFPPLNSGQFSSNRFIHWKLNFTVTIT